VPSGKRMKADFPARSLQKGKDQIAKRTSTSHHEA